MTPLPLFILSAVVITLGLYVWSANRENAVNRWFAILTFALAGWVFGIGGLQRGASLEEWGRFTFASVSLTPIAFLAFMHAYPSPGPWPSPFFRRGALAIGALFALLSLTTPLIIYDVQVTSSGLARKPGALYPIFALYMLSGWITALGLLVVKWRTARGLARAQIQYLGIGLSILAAGAITTNLLIPFLTGRSSYAWIGPYFLLPLVMLVAHAIIRHRLMDLRLIVNRGVAHVIGAAGISLVAIAGARLMAPSWDTRSMAIHPDLFIIGLTTLVTFSTPVHRLFTFLIDTYLFRNRLDYASALGRATRQLSRLMQPDQVSTEIQAILTDAFVPESFSMILSPLDKPTDNPIPAATLRAFVEAHPSPSAVLVSGMSPRNELTTAAAFQRVGVELVMILGRRGGPLAVILLGVRRSGDPYFAADIEFIESLTELASIALENGLLYKQRIQMLEYSDRLLEALDSAVVAVDAGGHITSFNPAAIALLGISAESRGSPLQALPSEVAWALAFALSGVWRPRETEVSIYQGVRGAVPVIFSTAVLHDQDRVAGALVVVTDLSAVKTLERNQRRVEHLAMMARFYTGIAHEIRSPLASISNFVAMLPDRFDDPEYRDTASRLLPTEVARIVRLAERLRLMAPSEGGSLKPIALSPLLADVTALHAPSVEHNGIRIALKAPNDLPSIAGDAGQLVQLFLNLLNNAAEAMPDGGTIIIEAEHLSTSTSDGRLVVRIIDEGVGVDAAIRGKVFQPFFTTKATGTGLGLAICREIADFHRARLALQPRRLAKGTIAEIEFPCPLAADNNGRHRTLTQKV